MDLSTLFALEGESLGTEFSDLLEVLKVAIALSIKETFILQCIYGNLSIDDSCRGQCHPSNRLEAQPNKKDSATQYIFRCDYMIEIPSQLIDQDVEYGKWFLQRFAFMFIWRSKEFYYQTNTFCESIFLANKKLCYQLKPQKPSLILHSS